jgi:phosphomannomutase/phosphoglucomutase
VEDSINAFPCSGELNFRVDDANRSIDRVVAKYSMLDPQFDFTDGVSMEFSEWRFNLRSSNTEPLLRLNVEARQNSALMREKTAEIIELLSRG